MWIFHVINICVCILVRSTIQGSGDRRSGYKGVFSVASTANKTFSSTSSTSPRALRRVFRPTVAALSLTAYLHRPLSFLRLLLISDDTNSSSLTDDDVLLLRRRRRSFSGHHRDNREGVHPIAPADFGRRGGAAAPATSTTAAT
jgi:hypothetical protein